MRTHRFFPALFSCIAASSAFVFAAPLPQAVAPAKTPLALRSPVENKNFLVLSALQEDSAARALLLGEPKLNRIASERENAAKAALETCKRDAACAIRSLLWTDEEIWAVSLALGDLYRSQPQLRALVEEKLRASGTYMLFEQESGSDLLENAWQSAARGINEVLSVYGEGEPPRYPQIDSLSFDPQSDDFKQRIAGLVAESISDTPAGKPTPLFFAPSLKTAMALLAMSRRDEAGRHEPMELGVNKAAFQALSSIRWSKYPYSVIVVPGAGPQDPNIALSAAGRARTALAADRYHSGQAPLILVSGGYVHPSQTRFSEAMEMKRALLEDYHVPESAVLVDPHARHTTTNMRNAVREIYRYNIPMSKPALAVSDAAQIAYIAGTIFSDRCMRELGYLPYRIVRQVSPTDLVFLPQIDSLEIDPMDPLDP